MSGKGGNSVQTMQRLVLDSKKKMSSIMKVVALVEKANVEVVGTVEVPSFESACCRDRRSKR